MTISTTASDQRIPRPVVWIVLLVGLLHICTNTFAQAPAVPSVPNPPAAALTRLETIGQRLFTDKNLSEPAGTACVSCHNVNTGFASNNGSRIGVPLGSRPGVVGQRNAMSNAYNTFVPVFSFKIENGVVEAQGGHFWDGRADTLALQALAPFLAAAEMNNPSAASVVNKVAGSAYANLIRAEFGAAIFSNPTIAFEKIGVAIAAFEASSSHQQFSSKYDFFVQGQVALNAAENRGMKLFVDTNRGNCASCHLMNPASKNPRDSLFSEFTYYATGIPRNKNIPLNSNPGFYDLGLCGPVRSKPALTNVPANVTIEQFCGKFRMVSLRNVAERQAFMHNGVFNNLREVISFYSTRNSDPQRWYGPTGIPNDLPLAYQANIINDRSPFNRPKSAGPVFSEAEIDDLLVFLKTLSDGYVAPANSAPTPPPGRQIVTTTNPFGK